MRNIVSKILATQDTVKRACTGYTRVTSVGDEEVLSLYTNIRDLNNKSFGLAFDFIANIDFASMLVTLARFFFFMAVLMLWIR